LATGFGEQDSVHLQPWPSHDPAQAIASTVELVVQLNGKIKARITVASDADEEEVRREALFALPRR
jgi:leucyl-tRNA synthetase